MPCLFSGFVDLCMVLLTLPPVNNLNTCRVSKKSSAEKRELHVKQLNCNNLLYNGSFTAKLFLANFANTLWWCFGV